MNTHTAPAPTHVYRTRDDYGRSVLIAERSAQRIAVIVTMPKRTRHLLRGAYLVNDLVNDRQTWHATARDARAAFDAAIA